MVRQLGVTSARLDYLLRDTESNVKSNWLMYTRCDLGIHSYFRGVMVNKITFDCIPHFLITFDSACIPHFFAIR